MAKEWKVEGGGGFMEGKGFMEGPSVGSKINRDGETTWFSERTGLPSFFFSSKQMHFKQAQGAPLLTMTNDSTWSFLSLLT